MIFSSLHMSSINLLQRSPSWFWHSGISPPFLLIITKNSGLWKVSKITWVGEKLKMRVCFPVFPPSRVALQQGWTPLAEHHGQSKFQQNLHLSGQRNQEEGYLQSVCVVGGVIEKRQAKKGSHNFGYESTQITTQPELCMSGAYPNQLL